jgi:hypothetical protein
MWIEGMTLGQSGRWITPSDWENDIANDDNSDVAYELLPVGQVYS